MGGGGPYNWGGADHVTHSCKTAPGPHTTTGLLNPSYAHPHPTEGVGLHIAGVEQTRGGVRCASHMGPSY